MEPILHTEPHAPSAVFPMAAPGHSFQPADVLQSHISILPLNHDLVPRPVGLVGRRAWLQVAAMLSPGECAGLWDEWRLPGGKDGIVQINPMVTVSQVLNLHCDS